jgi:hypothetical protein
VALRSTGPFYLRADDDNTAFRESEIISLKERIADPVTPLQEFVLNHEVFAHNPNRVGELLDKIYRLMNKT